MWFVFVISHYTDVTKFFMGCAIINAQNISRKKASYKSWRFQAIEYECGNNGKEIQSVKHQTVSLRHSFSWQRKERKSHIQLLVVHIRENSRKIVEISIFQVFFWVPFSSIQEVSVWFLFRYQRNHRILKHIRTVFFVVFHSKTSREKDSISLMEKWQNMQKEKRKLNKNASRCSIFRVLLFQ